MKRHWLEDNEIDHISGGGSIVSEGRRYKALFFSLLFIQIASNKSHPVYLTLC
jgi:hypothetical protein